MSIRKAALWSVTGQWLVFALNFTVSVVIARYLLPPSALGTFSVGFAAATTVSMLQDFGLSRYLVRAETLTDQMLATCTTITACVGVAICVVVAGLSWPVSWYYANPPLVPIMLLIGGAFLLLPLNTVPIALLQRAVDFRSLALINLAASAANGAVSALFAWWGYGAVSLALGFLAQQAARGFAAALLAPRRARFTWSFSGAAPVLSFGGGASVLAISGAIGVRSPDLIIGRVLGMHAVGLFGRAAGMVEGLRVLLDGGMWSVFFSHFAQLIRNKQPIDRPYLDLVACYTGVMWPAMALLALLAEPIVTLVYGPGWSEAAQALRWVALSEFAFFSLPLHSEVPLLTGHMKPMLVRNVIDTIVAVACLACLARFGLAAAGAARLLYAAIWFVIWLGLMRRIIGFTKAALFAVQGKSALSTLAAVLPVVALTGGGRVLTLDTAISSALAGGSLWLASLVVLRHPMWRELGRLVAHVRPFLIRPPRGSIA